MYWIFATPSAYVVSIVFLLLTGWFFISSLFISAQANLDAFFMNIPLFFLFFVPAVTMRLLAEEVRGGTIEIIKTMPVRDHEIVLGKFFAVWTFIGITLAATCTHCLVIGILGKPDWGQIATSYIGIFLLGGAFASVGIFSSSLTKNQIIAFIISFVVSFVFFISGKILFYVPAPFQGIVSAISIDPRMNTFMQGIIDISDIIYFLSITGLFLYGTLFSMDRERWK